MEESLAAMGKQLKLWSLKIDALVAKTQMAGVHTSFDTLMYIDELKALHAVAHSKLVESVRARAELDEVWSDLVAAFEKPMQ